jgi:LSU ribosomal protein L15P
MPLQRRLPKRGFTNAVHKTEYAVINVGDLERFDGETVVTPEVLRELRIIKKMKDGVKVLGDGEITKPLIVKAHAFSDQARRKIEEAGGKAEVI